MKISIDWLKEFVDLKPPFPEYARVLTEAGLEVEAIEKSPSGDTVFQVEVTTNRPDWLSHYGVARELSAAQGKALGKPLLIDEKKLSRTPPPGWKITCKDSEACPYYTGVLIEGITERKVPEFIKNRLESCGLRSIDLIVDITNYVLLELGQPLHAFDADFLTGNQIVIRRARKGEKLGLISGNSVELHENDLVIADENKALALAGVMGGKETEITERSRNVFLEVAHFVPRVVRETARRHQLTTDSSYRFERRVDPCLVETARLRALQLIQEYGKPRHISGVIQCGQKANPVIHQLHLTEDEVNAAIGCEIKTNQISSILNRLGLDVKPLSAKTWKVSVPSFRFDLTRPIDLIEEIARIYGYDNIPESLPSFNPGKVSVRPDRKLQADLRDRLCGAGFSEAVTFSLIGSTGFSEQEVSGMVRLRNPLQAGLELLRPTLLPGLLQAVQKNIRAGASSIGLFEIANVYRGASDSPAQEEKSVGIIFTGQKNELSWLDKPRDSSYFDIKGLAEKLVVDLLGKTDLKWESGIFSGLHAGVSEKLTVDGVLLGFVGQVSPAWLKLWDVAGPVYYAELKLSAWIQDGVKPRLFQEIPKFPAMERDLSMTMPEAVHCGQVEEEIFAAGGALLKQVRLFDLFQGGRIPKGFKNLSLRLTYLSPERTLTAEEIDSLHMSIGQKLAAKYEARFQS